MPIPKTTLVSKHIDLDDNDYRHSVTRTYRWT